MCTEGCKNTILFNMFYRILNWIFSFFVFFIRLIWSNFIIFVN